MNASLSMSYFFKIFIEVLLFYNVVLVTIVQQN